jgi:mRNA-degrading endonuclease RelE of RelBE toxin-antitoxin system
MTYEYKRTETFSNALRRVPPKIKKLFWEKLWLLLNDYRHKSLRAKRFDDSKWQVRISRNWRLYYKKEGAVLFLLDLTPHPK